VAAFDANPEIARERQIGRSSVDIAIEAAHGWDRQSFEQVAHGRERRSALSRSLTGKRLEVEPRTEARPVRSYDEDPDVLSPGERSQHGRHCFNVGRLESVVLMRSVQDNPSDINLNMQFRNPSPI
jgi:hypothetical protein